MGFHYAAHNNTGFKAFVGDDALDRALEFAGPGGSVCEMSGERARELGLSNPVSGHELREVSLESNTMLWVKGEWHTATGNRPVR